MADETLLKNVISHLVNGTLEQSLCRVCLSPVDDESINIFTRVCKADKEYCMADVLENVCHIEISQTENSVVCPDCFIAASVAYKFYLTTQCSMEILKFYVTEIEKSISPQELPSVKENICLLLPLVDVSKLSYDFDLEGMSLKYNSEEISEGSENEYECEYVCSDSSEDDEKPSDKAKHQRSEKNYKIRRKRKPMPFLPCSKCGIMYRWISKLQNHMEKCHNIKLFCCKVCNDLVEGTENFKDHMNTHGDVHVCPECGGAFKTANWLRRHMLRHRPNNGIPFICVECGEMCNDEIALTDHQEKKHNDMVQYTCHYCSKNYKLESSLEMHIRKHEKLSEVGTFDCDKCPMAFSTSRQLYRHAYAEHSADIQCAKCPRKFATTIELEDHKKTHTDRFTCEECIPVRCFVDARSLLWHKRLHDNVRPYKCELCDKSFVSLNRRKQHTLTAHSAPEQRCPLCPSRFHLRSMVNTHIKKVHVASNKRRYRCNRFSGMAPLPAVPPCDLSLDVQQDVVEHMMDATEEVVYA